MKNLVLICLLLIPFASFGNDIDFIKKVEKAIVENDAGILNSRILTLQRAKAKAMKLLRQYQSANKFNEKEMLKIVREANLLWPKLGESKEGVKEAIIAIRNKALGHLDN